MGLSQRVVDHALSNGGSITSAEVQALGGTREWISRREQDGWLERIGPNTYRLPGSSSEWHSTLAAACHRLGAVVSHESAAELFGMPRLRNGLLIVSVPVRRSNRFPGVDVRQKTDIAPDHVTVMRDLPVTTPARTVFDLAAELGVRRLARLVDWNVAQGLTSYETLQTLFEHLARKGKPGTKRMRHVLEDRSGRAERSSSELEGLTSELIAGAGLPPPTREFRAPWLTPTNGRIDFAYEDKRLVIEADSRRWHAMADAFLTDRERDNRAQLAGWRVLRFTWWDVEQRPEYVVLSIRQALDLAQT